MMNTILLVEDDAVLSEMYKDKLEFSNFSVSTVQDGQKGLELALQNKPDLILLDLLLPKINGIDIMHKLRSDSWGKTVPIIVLTNLDVDGKVLDGIVMYKPVYCLIKSNTTPEDVIAKAQEILDNLKTKNHE